MKKTNRSLTNILPALFFVLFYLFRPHKLFVSIKVKISNIKNEICILLTVPKKNTNK
jgi:hypothetical protein